MVIWTAELCVQRVLVTLKASPFPVFMKKTGKHKRHTGGRTRAISAHLALSALLAFVEAFRTLCQLNLSRFSYEIISRNYTTSNVLCLRQYCYRCIKLINFRVTCNNRLYNRKISGLWVENQCMLMKEKSIIFWRNKKFLVFYYFLVFYLESIFILCIYNFIKSHFFHSFLFLFSLPRMRESESAGERLLRGFRFHFHTWFTRWFWKFPIRTVSVAPDIVTLWKKWGTGFPDGPVSALTWTTRCVDNICSYSWYRKSVNKNRKQILTYLTNYCHYFSSERYKIILLNEIKKCELSGQFKSYYIRI